MVLVYLAVGSVLFIGAVLLTRWIFGIPKIIALLEQLVSATGAVPITQQEIPRRKPMNVPTSLDQTEVCRHCGAFKACRDFCPDCGSGWEGDEIKPDLATTITATPAKENVQLPAYLASHSVCKKCQALKAKGAPCPQCGAAPRSA